MPINMDKLLNITMLVTTKKMNLHRIRYVPAQYYRFKFTTQIPELLLWSQSVRLKLKDALQLQICSNYHEMNFIPHFC